MIGQVEQRAVAALVPYARNARTHSDEQVQQIAASISAFGWTNPILIDEGGGIIAGHGRLAAAKLLGMESVPVISLAGLSETARRALVLADNKLALNAGWNFGLLAEELAELDVGDFDVGLIGFSDAELEQIATWTPGAMGTAGNYDGGGAGQLSDRFMLPPFSTLNAREGWWQDRKARWIALGIQSELGRGDNALKFSAAARAAGPRGIRAAAVKV